MKIRKCCICVPIAHGVIALGAIDILNFMMSCIKMDPFHIVMLFAPCLTFILMVYKDTRETRKRFLAAFIFYRIILLGLFLFKVYVDFFGEPIMEEQKAVSNRCNMI